MAWSDEAIPNQLLAWIPNAKQPSDPKKAQTYEGGLERLKNGLELLPLPHGFTESILGLRAVVRAQRADGIETDDALRLIHWLAAIDSFRRPQAERLREPGFNVFDATPRKEFHDMVLDWDVIGCEELDALNKTDRKLMIQLWGAPEKHTTAHSKYQGLWRKIEDQLIDERAAGVGLTSEEYLQRQGKIYAKLAEEDKLRHQSKRAEQELHEKARNIASSATDRPVFLDLETTGLSTDADEILEIGIVDHDGNILLEQLTKPEFRTEWPEAYQIHGISPGDVRTAPTLASIEQRIVEAVANRLVVIYNAPFDVGFLPASVIHSAAAFVCAMDLYRSTVRQGRARLSDAENWAGFRRGKSSRHRAIGDASATLEVWNKLRVHHGDNFSEAVARATISPEAEALKKERIAQDQERLTISVGIGDVLRNGESTPIQGEHASSVSSGSVSTNRVLVGLAVVLVILLLGWLALIG